MPMKELGKVVVSEYFTQGPILQRFSRLILSSANFLIALRKIYAEIS